MAQDIRTKRNSVVRIFEGGLYHNERIMVYYRQESSNKMVIDMDMIIGQDRIKKMNQDVYCDWDEFTSKHKDSLPEFNYWNKI